MLVYNSQKHSWVTKIKLGTVGLDYTRHAVLRCCEKGIMKQMSLTIDGNVIECERPSENGPVVKLVVRQRYDNRNDVVFVLTRSSQHGCLKVVTVWLNNVNDTHDSLNMARIA